MQENECQGSLTSSLDGIAFAARASRGYHPNFKRGDLFARLRAGENFFLIRRKEARGGHEGYGNWSLHYNKREYHLADDVPTVNWLLALLMTCPCLRLDPPAKL